MAEESNHVTNEETLHDIDTDLNDGKKDMDSDEEEDMDEDASFRVLVDRPSFTTSKLHHRYGYRPAGRRGFVDFMREKISKRRCDFQAVKSKNT